MTISNLLIAVLQGLTKYPKIGTTLASFFGSLEVPILEFRRIFDKFILPGFYNSTIPLFNTIYGSRIIPLNINLQHTKQILATEEISEIIDRMPIVAIGYCYCRSTYQKCDNSVWTCIHIGMGKRLKDLSNKIPMKTITKEQAKKIVSKADKQGLVHQLITAPTSEYFYVICNCCPCCCIMLKAIKQYGKLPSIIASNFISHQDGDKCTDCGKCINRCYFGARYFSDNKLFYDSSKCLGCGLCISVCPEDVIRLLRRNKTQ
ncbi:MAG: DUF362 domain-containing protein [Promethearchaeota archaeon]